MKTIFLDGNSLTIPIIDELARQKVRIQLTPAAKRRIVSARRLIDSWVESDRTVYGVTTGFGEFSNVRIDQKDIGQLQENLILSHAAGAGDPLPPEVVRAMMALRVNSHAKGHSGARLETVQMVLDFMRKVEGGRTIKAGRGIEAAYRFVRTHIDHLERDRILHKDLQTALELVRNNAVLNCVEKIIGSLDS